MNNLVEKTIDNILKNERDKYLDHWVVLNEKGEIVSSNTNQEIAIHEAREKYSTGWMGLLYVDKEAETICSDLFDEILIEESKKKPKSIDELAREQNITDEWVLAYDNKIVSHNKDKQKAMDEARLKYKSNVLAITYIPSNRDDELEEDQIIWDE